MCHAISRSDNFVPALVIGTIAAGLITMLVMGILGAQGTLSLSPVGTRLLLGLPTAAGTFVAVRFCCGFFNGIKNSHRE